MPRARRILRRVCSLMISEKHKDGQDAGLDDGLNREAGERHGNAFTCPEADYHLDDVYDLPSVIPHLFPSLKAAVPAAAGNSLNFYSAC